MADHKIIVLLSSEPAIGRRTLAENLCRTWAAQDRSVLWIASGDLSTAEPPHVWVPRFKNLPPHAFRNFLADTLGSYSRLTLPQWSPDNWCKDLLSLSAAAYDRILVMGPTTLATESAMLLDSADLLLWVARPSPDLPARWQEFQSELASLHLPQHHARLILNRVPAGQTGKYQAESVPLAVLPEDSTGSHRWRGAIQSLCGVLESRTDLYRARESLEQVKSDSCQMVEQIKSQVQPQLLKALEAGAAGDEPSVARQAIEACLAAEAAAGQSREERGQIVTRVLEDVLGFGPLELLLKDPEVSEILVNGAGTLYIEKRGKLYPTPVRFASESQLRTIIDRIVAPIGRRVDESSPLCDARLPDGSRVNIVLPPLALDGPTITIRKFSAKKFDLNDLAHMGSMSEEMRDFLQRQVVSRQNIVVSGGTGSGKTTLLNALSSAIPDDERIVTIEDAAELKLHKPHVVRLESRPPNAEGQGAIPIRRLVMNALRMRPDRIVVGECRGGEALDMLQAMNTGHDGSLTTLHANTPRDALGRLETLVLMAGMDLPMKVVREQIRSAVHLIVQQSRLLDGSRKVTSITEVTGMEGDILTTQELFRYAGGTFHATGLQTAAKVRHSQ